MRPTTSLTSIAFATALLASTGALAATTTVVWWSGKNDFNKDDMEVEPKFKANYLLDITGLGLYEGCCTNQDTSFKLDLKIKDDWKTIYDWKTTGDDNSLPMDTLLPKPIKFSDDPVYVRGIRLTSKLNGEEGDKNFTNFNVVPLLALNSYSSKCGEKKESEKDDDDCDDDEHSRPKGTSFVFCSGPDCLTGPTGGEPLPTPLPAALPLMGSVLGGFGFAMWRRRRKKSA